MQIHQHGATGVGDIGDVDAAANATGQVPNQKGIDGAKQGVASLGVGT